MVILSSFFTKTTDIDPHGPTNKQKSEWVVCIFSLVLRNYHGMSVKPWNEREAMHVGVVKLIIFFKQINLIKLLPS